MAKVGYRLVPGAASQMMMSADVVKFLDAIGAKIEDQARKNAPRKTGEHASTIARRTRRRGDRMVVEITAATDHSLVLEAQTGAMAKSIGAGRALAQGKPAAVKAGKSKSVSKKSNPSVKG